MLAIGISGMIGIQAFINLGGMSGTIPITGVTLPFISYGDLPLLCLSIAMGILANVSMFRTYEERFRQEKAVPDIQPSSSQPVFKGQNVRNRSFT